MSRPRPDFVIIGAQKSGSTALTRHLAAHRQVFLPDLETRYFRDPWYQFEDVTVLEDAVAPAGPGVRRRGIKSPDYLASPESARRIRDVLGPVDVLAVLRDPVLRAVSAYHWGMQWGWVPLAPVDEGLSALLDGRVDAEYPRASEVLDYGRYGAHLRRYRDLFPRVTVMLDEDLHADRLSETLARVHRTLGVDPLPPSVAASGRVNEGVYSLPRLRFLALRHRYILREFPGFPGRRYLQPAVGVRGRLVNRAVSTVDRVVLRRVLPNRRPTLAPAVAQRLRDHYADDVTALEQMIERDLSRWRLPV